MQKPIRRCLFLAALMLFFGISAFAEEPVATVYYVPFDSETYIAITPDTIVNQAREKFPVSSNTDMLRFARLLADGESGKFDRKRTRAAVITNDKKWYIDSYGVVSDGEGTGIKIDRDSFFRFVGSLRLKQAQ